MDSTTSKAMRPVPTKLKTVTITQDIIDEILDHLATGSEPLLAYALVSKSWVHPCRRHLFRIVFFTSRNMEKWFKTFPVHEESPAHHVRDLRVRVGGGQCVPESFFEFTQCFSNLERICLNGYGGIPPLRIPSLWRLPQSLTSLFVPTNTINLVQIRDIMGQLPNLNNLYLEEPLAAVDREELAGIGTILSGKFGGNFSLYAASPNQGVIDMLLEIPSGLHFTEVQVHYKHNHLPSVVRLAEACCKTLVKLSHVVASHGKPHLFS